MSSAAPLVSVVVPTHCRPALLDCCLRALLAQDLCGQRYEMIVCDDAASGATRCQVHGWAAVAHERHICLRYVAVSGAHGPAAARNAGWRIARGPIIAFTDDDCIVSPGWLSAGLAAFGPIACGEQTVAFDGVRVDGARGHVIVPLAGAPTDYQRDAARLTEGEFVTANCFYRRDVLEAVGGFDERFRAAWREDSDLHFRVLERGARLVAAPDAVVVHPVRPAPWGISLRQQRKSMYNALLYKKHPQRYRELIQSAPPCRYYLTLGALLGALAGLLSGRRGLAGMCAALWLGMTSEFFARRLRGVSHAPSHVAEMAVTSAIIPLLSIFWRLRGALKFRVWFL